MTRKEFDAATKENWGSRCMASDERQSYKCNRATDTGSDNRTSDFIQMRANVVVQIRSTFDWKGKVVATLGVPFKFRAWAISRRDSGRPLLCQTAFRF